MYHILTFRWGNQRLHFLKLIGAFILLGGALMLLSNVYKLFWIASVIENVNAGGIQTISADLAGVTINQQLQQNDLNTQVGLLLVPVAGVMFWAAVIILGTLIYRSGGFIMPPMPATRPMPPARLPVKRRRKSR